MKRLIWLVISITVLTVVVFTMMDMAASQSVIDPVYVTTGCSSCGEINYRTDHGPVGSMVPGNNFRKLVIDCYNCGAHLFSLPGWFDRFGTAIHGVFR